MPNKSVREQAIKRVEIELEGRCFATNNNEYTVYGVSGVIVDAILALFEPMGEEDMADLIYFKRKEYIESFGNNEVSIAEHIAHALSTTLKPSWTDLELDKILPPAGEIKNEKDKDFDNDDYICNIVNKAINEYRETCKQAILLGKDGK